MFTYLFYAVVRSATDRGSTESTLTAKLPRDKPTYADIQAWQDFTKKDLESKGHVVSGSPIVVFFSALANKETN